MQEMMQEEDEVNLLEYWNVLWRRKYLLIALSAVSVIATMIIGLQSPKFFISDTILMTSGSESGGLGAALSSLPFAGALGGVGGQSSADRIMVILKSRTIAEAVVNKLDLHKVFNEKQWDAAANTWKDPQKPPLMSDTLKTMTGLVKFNKSKEGAITVSAEWKDPKLTADIANYYVFALTDFLREKSVTTTIQIIDKAVPADRKSRPKIFQSMMLAGITSLFIGIFIAFFLEYLSKQKKA